MERIVEERRREIVEERVVLKLDVDDIDQLREYLRFIVRVRNCGELPSDLSRNFLSRLLECVG